MTIASERATAAPIPAVGYIRCSTHKQTLEDGPKRQREVIQRFASERGYVIAGDDWFQDAVTGTTDDLGLRQEYARMLDRLAANCVRVVLIEKADRLARRLIVQELLLEDLKKLGVQVIDASGNDLSVLDDDPDRVMIRQILGAIAQHAKTVLALRMRAARERIRASGRQCEGGKRYGQMDGEEMILQRMLRERAEGKGLDQIAAGLNSDGILSRRGLKWSRQVIGEILRRQTKTGRRRGRPRGKVQSSNGTA